MATIDPFWMHDRVDPEKDNDGEEVIKAANAADALTGIPTAKTPTMAHRGQKTLPSLLRHFDGIQLTVELKTGRQYTGILISADNSMDLTLENVSSSCSRRSRAETDTSVDVLPLMHVRGSTIRYIHFPDNLDLSLTIKQSLER